MSSDCGRTDTLDGAVRRASSTARGTSAEDDLTLVYFPAEDSDKAVLDGPWRVLPDALAGSGATLRREKSASEALCDS